MAQLECKNLKLGYENITLTEDLSFSVEQGDYLCIVGENGAGKSTLMRTILKLQKPLAGSIEFADGMTASKIGYLPQQTIVQKDFPASVYEVVLSGCQNSLGHHLFYSKAAHKLALKNIVRMGIGDLTKRCYRELSGGQQQRVLLARALCATEQMLLLDEPVSGLDPMVTLEMYELIKKLNDEGITVIMISHDIAASVKYAKHILHIGNEFFFGTVGDYKKSAAGSKYLEGSDGASGVTAQCGNTEGAEITKGGDAK